MTYCALRFAAEVVLPKWPAAVTASTASPCSVAALGDAADSSAQIPASVPPPVGYATCVAVVGQDVAPAATPSQYCVMTPDQVSLLVPSPLNSCCSRGATPDGSPLNVVLPFA